METNAGLTFRLLCERRGQRNGQSLYYEPGMQWEGWAQALDVMQGRGINRQIRRAYGFLASHYRPGDRIFLFGYSRGAYAVRSLAGVIDRVGLLRHDQATERKVQLAYRHYQMRPGQPCGPRLCPRAIAMPRRRSRWSASGIRSRRLACACRCCGC